MDLYDLEIGYRVRLTDGSIAEVIAETIDGRAIRVRYIKPADPAKHGAERLCSEDEVEARVRTY